MASTIDAVAAGQPKAIALDVLFSDATNQESDETLARSIGRAGNVVVAAQLTESPVHGGPSRWLLPLPAVERAAAAVGHVNVQTEMEGVARAIEVQSADDSGQVVRTVGHYGLQSLDQRKLIRRWRASARLPSDITGLRELLAHRRDGTTAPRGTQD